MTTTAPTGLVPCEKRRILITDDEESVREIFRMILSGGIHDCTIDVATNGIEAVQSFRQFHQGVLLMDLKMPQMDGQTAFYKIRDICEEKGWEIPAVIFCTGFAPSPDVLSLTNPESEHSLIRKPVPLELLLETVKSRMPAV